MAEHYIQIKNLKSFYEDDEGNSFEALSDISLNISKGEFVCIVGPSGCGKSTFLSVLEGLLPVGEGKVLIGEKEIFGPGNERAVVFQNYSLFPWMTAKQNVAFAVYHANKNRGHKISKKESLAVADDFINKVELSTWGEKLPGELSGGMQQRVAIARAMACNPDILLLDEPFGALDPKIRENLQELLLKLWTSDKEKKTIIFVTHDLNEAILLADTIVVMMPRRIHNTLSVPFGRPRKAEDIYASAEYKKLYEKLKKEFDDIQQYIADEEVSL